MEKLSKRIDLKKSTALIALIALIIILSIATDTFLTVTNMTNVLQQVTVNAIIAIGLSFVILTGGIDLSVGSIVAFSGVLMGLVLSNGGGTMVGMIVCVLSGAVIGLLNGFLVSFGKLPAFIATLGTMSVARGLALTVSNGKAISGFTDDLRWIGVENIPGINIPVQVILMLLLFVIAHYLLKYRKFGRSVYAIGGNEEVTRLSGINVKKYKTLVYMISGITSGIAAIVLTAKLNSAQPIAGNGYELDAIAATVIGGTSLSGGVGFIWGTLIGAIMMGVIRNGLNLLTVSTYLQQCVIGVVIVCAVLLDSMKKR